MDPVLQLLLVAGLLILLVLGAAAIMAVAFIRRDSSRRIPAPTSDVRETGAEGLVHPLPDPAGDLPLQFQRLGGNEEGPFDRVRIRILGGLFLDGSEGPPPGRRPLAVLARLLAEHPSPMTRERLSAFLWPDHSSRRARHRLSDSLYLLRACLGAEAIGASGDELRVNEDVVSVDLWDFDAALRRGDMEEAVRLHAGPFLDGFSPSDESGFEQWVDLERARISRRFRDALEALALRAEEAGEPREAARWWRRLAEEDPAREVAILRLMRALEGAGERAEALRWAERHIQVMEVEFEAEAGPGVLAMADRLREARGSLVRAVVEDLPPPNVKGWSSPEALLDPEPSDSSGIQPMMEGPPVLGRQEPPSSRVAPPPLPPDSPTPTPHRSLRPAATAAFLAALLSLPLLAPSLRFGGSSPNSDRVLVLPLQNRTGDPGLDALGDLAADRIILGVSRSGLAPVAPLEEGIRSAARVDAGGPPWQSPLLGLRIDGFFHVAGDSLQFQVTVADPERDIVLSVVGPVVASREDPVAGLEELVERTVAVLALHRDMAPGVEGLREVQPPRIDAYRAYVEGSRAFVARRFGEAAERYTMAIALDSTFHPARLALAWTLGNLGRFDEARTLVPLLQEVERQLAPVHRLSLGLLEAAASGDPLRRYEAARRAGEADPGGPHRIQWGTEALRSMNRPREALQILEGMPVEGVHHAPRAYWEHRAMAYHALGEHRRELAVAREARRENPDQVWPLDLEAVALAALGRIEAMERVVGERMVRSFPGAGHPLEASLNLAFELLAHGHPEAADRILERGADWYRALVFADQEDRRHLAPYALLLMHSGEPSAAEAILRQLVEENPQESSLAGFLGVLTAERGEREEGRGISDWLGALERTDPFSNHLFMQACVVAALGEVDEAVAVLRMALRGGAPYHPRPHRFPCFQRIRSDPALQELLRPAG